uniref:CDC42 effector protein (Rho GTPase binding) 5 n=1 Tax=Oryzias latipes TaxID=8090 RepID=H2M6P8_ORYLA
MPLHKSSRAPRLDPTMISAPLGDFRHTMHIGRGGDAFGDTSFLSKVDSGKATPDLPAAESELTVNHSDLHTEAPGIPQDTQLKHSESLSSLTLDLDLDLDLGPSMLGDVLGVMDGLSLEPHDTDPRSMTQKPESRTRACLQKLNKTRNEINHICVFSVLQANFLNFFFFKPTFIKVQECALGESKKQILATICMAHNPQTKLVLEASYCLSHVLVVTLGRNITSNSI